MCSPLISPLPPVTHPSSPSPLHLAPVATSAQAEAVLAQLSSLPTLAPIAARLMTLSSSADAQLDEIITLIEADPALSTRMLSLCRRSDVAAGRSITSVRRAVIHLGLEAVQSALLSVQVYELLNQAPAARERRAPQTADAAAPAPAPSMDRVGFWRHSVAVACCAETLARHHRRLKVKPEEAFTAGLVHDLGKLVLDWILPRSYEKAVQLAQSRAISLAEAERRILAVDHHLVGKRLGERWTLPHALQDTMWLHGAPAATIPESAHRNVILIVTLANALCRHLHLGWSGSCDAAPDLVTAAGDLGLSVADARTAQATLAIDTAARCADLGLPEVSESMLFGDSIAAAGLQIERLHRLCAHRAESARGHGRTLEELARFQGSARAGQHLESVAGEVIRGFLRATAEPAAGPGFVALVMQSRPGGAWRIARLDPGAEAAVISGDLEPPTDLSGVPVPLAGDERETGLDSAIAVITWFSENIAAGAATPDLRSIRMLPLPPTMGPTFALIHDRAWRAMPNAGTDVLLGAWARGLAGALQHDGARGLSERLADANRAMAALQNDLANTRSLARLGELAAGAAHEMNNPLAVISGRAQTLATRLAGDKDRESAQQIAAAADRLTTLITDLHLIARPPAPARKATAVGELLTTLARQFVAAAAAPGAMPTITVDAGRVQSRADIDPKLFGRALGEIVANALQASGGASVRLCAWSEDEGGDRLVIEVCDDGPGFSSYAREHAFDPFFSEKPAGRRPGLGLPIARALIAAHGGEISIEAAPALVGGPVSASAGRGAVVRIAVPRWRAGSEGGISSRKAAA
ncbi:hypothetical protein BH11PLA1_BH11PLA1_24250 [soil metagenome]